MFTVGLISRECIKTYNYTSLELAKEELKSWKSIFMNNHNVKSYTTIIERDGNDNSIKSIKYIFGLEHTLGLYYMFLSKNNN
jgi:hypothetical protein